MKAVYIEIIELIGLSAILTRMVDEAITLARSLVDVNLWKEQFTP